MDIDSDDTDNTPNDARNLEAGTALIGAGAVLLLVSLFLTWYQPGINAWEIFEVWDLVLAVLALVALTALAGRIGLGRPRPSSWLVAPAMAVWVIVLFAIINPPPLSGSVDGAPATGLWLALAASVLMAAGALLSVARISVAISATQHDGPGASAAHESADRGARAGSYAPQPDKPTTSPPPAVDDDTPSEDRTRRL